MVSSNPVIQFATTLRQTLFPWPRRRLDRTAAISPILFLVSFYGICWWLDHSNILMFSRPAWLSIGLFSVWIWWIHLTGLAGLPNLRGLLAAWLRMSIVGAFAMLLAEPRSVQVRDIVSVVYALDASDSIGEATGDEALKFILETANKKPPKDEAGLVLFGKRAAVETPPRESFVFEALNTQPDRGATNIEQALSLSAAVIPEDHQGRIVLLSDGVETDGDLARTIRDLQSRKISVDVLPVGYQYDEEVWLERMDLPSFIKLGETYEASVLINSLKAGRGKIILRENGKTIAELPADYTAGKSRITFPLALRTAGYYEYTATIEPEAGQDHLERNNTVLNSLFVEGEGRVLLVTDPAGSRQDWEPLRKALLEGERHVQLMESLDFPREPSALLPYDAILFVNVAHDNFDPEQLNAMRDAVFHLGIGFVMVGGTNSFGPGGYHRTAIEEILPVSMDAMQKKMLPKGALAIILHTCEFPEGNEWAKRITKKAIEILSPQDDAGVLAYGHPTGEGWIFPLMPVSRRDEMIIKINGAAIGDMPSFQATMSIGLNGLLASDASAKHMIIISDGDPQPPTPELVQQFVDNKISCSMVAVFPHGGQEISKMRAIAELTGGRYYYVNDDPNRLPAIFIKESKTLKRTMIQNREFQPEIGFPSPVIKGIEAIPPLKGYVLTSLKPRAQQVLQAPPKPDAPDEIDPILAIWQHGLGKTAAFTSDLSPKWGDQWISWEHYQAFVKQLMTEIARVEKLGKLRVSAMAQGGEAIITAEDFDTNERSLEVQARISGPGDKIENITLKQVRPRRYQAVVPIWGHGRYHVAASAKGDGHKDNAFAGFVIPYSPEYLRFRANPRVLEDLARQTGGELLSPQTTAKEIYERTRSPRRSSRPMFEWFLWVMACVIPVDVGLRKVQLDWSVIRSWFVRGPAVDIKSTSALLQRKQQVASRLEPRSERPLPMQTTLIPPTGTATTSSAQPTQNASPSTPKPVAQNPASTAEKLLKLKRRREEDEGHS